MKSREAVKLAYTEFQKDFEEGEETNQWLTDVINGLKKAEKDLEVLEILKKYYKSDGWSNGGVIEFWEMTKTQINKIWKWLENE